MNFRITVLSIYLLGVTIFQIATTKSLSFSEEEEEADGKTALKEHSPIAEFLLNLLSTKYKLCNIFILTDTTVINLNLYNRLEFLYFISQLQEQGHYLAHTRNIKKKFRYRTGKSVRRLSSHCSLVLSFIFNDDTLHLNQTRQHDHFVSKFSPILVPKLGNIVKKDEDHFIFVTPNDLSSNQLFLHPLSLEIKYKLVISFDIDDPSPIIELKTLCFYCDHGSPEIITVQKHNVGNSNSNTNRLINGDNKNNYWENQNQKNLFPDFVRSGNGHTLRNSCQTRLLFMVEIIKLSNSTWDYKRGFGWFILREILNKLNFTYTAFPSFKTGGSGTYKKRVWDGIVRDVIDGRADIGVGVTTDNTRFRYVGGTVPITFLWVNFILGEPQKTYTWEALFWPLDRVVWFYCLVSSFIFTVLFTISSHLAYRKYLNSIPLEGKIHVNTKTKSNSDDTVEDGGDDKAKIKTGSQAPPPTPHHHKYAGDGNLYVNLIGGVLEQSVALTTALNSAKILCSIFLFGTLILRTAYRSKLFGLTMFPLYEEQPKTYHDLIKSPGYEWALESSAVGSSAHNFFLTSPSPLYKAVFENMGFEGNTKKCFAKTLQGKFACLTFDGQAEYMIYRNYSSRFEKLNLKISTDAAAMAMPAIVMRKGAIYRTNFNRVISAAVEMGVIMKMKWIDFANERKKYVKWAAEKEFQTLFSDENSDGLLEKEAESDLDVLILENLEGTFYVFFAGIILSVLVFIFEMCMQLRNCQKGIFQKFKRTKIVF